MAKTFKKNDAVAVVADWDRKGTAYVRRAIVQAWGAKVIRLIDAATGEMFKVSIGTQFADSYDYKIVADTDNAALEAMALEMGAAIVARETEQYKRVWAAGAMPKGFFELHEPRVMWR